MKYRFLSKRLFKPIVVKTKRLEIDLQTSTGDIEEDAVTLLDGQGRNSDILLGNTEDTLERRVDAYNTTSLVFVGAELKETYGEPRKHSLPVQQQSSHHQTACGCVSPCQIPIAS